MKIKVKPGNTINDGKDHPPGEVFEVPDKDGKYLISLGVAEEAVGEPKNQADLSAKEKIELIAVAETIEAVKALLKDEERVTVVEAGKARLKELKAGE